VEPGSKSLVRSSEARIGCRRGGLIRQPPSCHDRPTLTVAGACAFFPILTGTCRNTPFPPRVEPTGSTGRGRASSTKHWRPPRFGALAEQNRVLHAGNDVDTAVQERDAEGYGPRGEALLAAEARKKGRFGNNLAPYRPSDLVGLNRRPFALVSNLRNEVCGANSLMSTPPPAPPSLKKRWIALAAPTQSRKRSPDLVRIWAPGVSSYSVGRVAPCYRTICSNCATSSFSPGNSSAAGNRSRRLSTNVLPCQSWSVCSKPRIAISRNALRSPR